MELTELIQGQLKTFFGMAAAGILIESLWQGKWLLQRATKHFFFCVIQEIIFWFISAVVISMFMYYCSFGTLTFHGGAGFLAGLLLWKKICCGIIGSWVKTDEAENSKITVKSLTWKRQEKGDLKKDVQRGKKKRERLSLPKKKRHGGRQLSEEGETEDA